jgi:hypothetical protein
MCVCLCVCVYVCVCACVSVRVCVVSRCSVRPHRDPMRQLIPHGLVRQYLHFTLPILARAVRAVFCRPFDVFPAVSQDGPPCPLVHKRTIPTEGPPLVGEI